MLSVSNTSEEGYSVKSEVDKEMKQGRLQMSNATNAKQEELEVQNVSHGDQHLLDLAVLSEVSAQEHDLELRCIRSSIESKRPRSLAGIVRVVVHSPCCQRNEPREA